MLKIHCISSLFIFIRNTLVRLLYKEKKFSWLSKDPKAWYSDQPGSNMGLIVDDIRKQGAGD